MKSKKNKIVCLTFLLSLLSSSAYAWDIKKYDATKEEPATASFCAIKNDYQEGISLTFVKNTKGEMSLFFAFRDLTFPVQSNQLMNVIFKDANNQLPPKMFQGDGTAIQEKLLKSSSFGQDVNLDLIGLYSNVEVVVANKAFTVPLLEDWRSSTQKLKLCASEIRIHETRVAQPAPVVQQQLVVEPTQEVVAPVTPAPKQEAVVETKPVVKEEPVKKEPPSKSIFEMIGDAIEPIITPEAEPTPIPVAKTVVEPKAEPKVAAQAPVPVKKDYAFLKEVMAQSDLQSVEYDIVNDGLVNWKHADMTGSYQEYKLADQEGHSTEKLSRIAENTLFSLRKLCAGAFVNDVGRMEHSNDKSFVRANTACSMKDKETTSTILFVEAGAMAYVFTQEGDISQGAQLIEFRDKLLKIVQKSSINSLN